MTHEATIAAAHFLRTLGWDAVTESPTGNGRRRCDIFATHPDHERALVVEAKWYVGGCEQRSALAQLNGYRDDFAAQGISTYGLLVAHGRLGEEPRFINEDTYATNLRNISTALYAMGLLATADRQCPTCRQSLAPVPVLDEAVGA